MNCRKCGTELPAGAMFCAECGATVTVPRLVEPQTRTRPGDTAIIQPLDLNVSVPEFLEPDFERAAAAPEPVRPAPVRPAPVEPTAVEPAPAEPVVEVPAPARVETTPARRVSPAPVLPAAVLPAPVVPAAAVPPVAAPPTAAPPAAAPPAVVPSSRTPDTAVRLSPPARPAAPDLAPASSFVPAPAPAAPASSFESEHDDLEATRIVRNRQGERFVLQFSTGENSTVFGSGLIGRNPVMQPGEYVDQLVTIVDSGKSVSKTHLEFGQTAGVFWIIDRFSANGTVVRQPDVRPQRVDPGKRQTIARGTRVDIGEQFFVVS